MLLKNLPTAQISQYQDLMQYQNLLQYQDLMLLLFQDLLQDLQQYIMLLLLLFQTLLLVQPMVLKLLTDGIVGGRKNQSLQCLSQGDLRKGMHLLNTS